MECEKCKGTEKTTQRSDEEKKNLIKSELYLQKL